MDPSFLYKVVRLTTVLTFLLNHSFAQLLNKPVTVSARQQPVSVVLKKMGDQGKFYFSYNSDLVPGDSLVTLQVSNQPLSSVLNQLFPGKYQYKEKGDYLIILAAPRDKSLYLSGIISDIETSEPVDFASVYSRSQLVSTMTQENGHFRLRFREKAFPVHLTISKVGYGDTTIVIQSVEKADLHIGIAQKAVDLDPLIVRYSEGESTWLGRMFLSAKTRMQSRNIGRFFVSLPLQASLTPGLGTHGRMSPQVVNKGSLNLIGGYTGGVNGVEVAGVFNISRKDVRFVQIAGAFNVVSGHVAGVQVAGFSNHILDSLRGVQISGFTGITRKTVQGVQASGFLSRAGADVSGVQFAGAINHVRGRISGAQFAGLVNIASGDMRGWQVGPVNFARNLKGLQVGVVNIADSTSGVSLGLFNFIKKSTSNVSVFASDLVPVNVAWKMGTHRFYTILSGGIAPGNSSRAYVFGGGFGSEFFPFKKAGLFTEITSQNVFLGKWDNIPSVYRFNLAATWKPMKHWMLFAGPVFSVYHHTNFDQEPGYKNFPLNHSPGFKMSNALHGWIGWQLGLSWRYGRL